MSVEFRIDPDLLNKNSSEYNNNRPESKTQDTTDNRSPTSRSDVPEECYILYLTRVLPTLKYWIRDL